MVAVGPLGVLLDTRDFRYERGRKGVDPVLTVTVDDEVGVRLVSPVPGLRRWWVNYTKDGRCTVW